MPLPSRNRSAAPARLLALLAPVAAAVAVLAPVPPLAATAANVLPSVYEPAGTGGYAALDRALAKLQTHRRLLVIGAHPDDEDTSALALVSRELGGEAAYLSLSRGEGGQNLIGPDLGEALGVLRTEELLAARGVDGARQYFTRAFDFGYTRSLPETLGKWPEELLLADAVRVVRRFKPQVVLSVFGNDGSGGHGQHQAAGHTAFLAFARSAEALPQPEADAEMGAPWKALALYRAAWFAPESATVSRPLGGIDPWSGLSILQVAMKSRSQHRSQDMGRLLELGPRDGKYTYVEGPGGAAGTDLFAGIDTSLPGLAATLGATPLAAAVRRELESAAAEIAAADAALRPERMADTVAPLVRALAALDRAHAACAASPLPEARPVAELVAEKIAIGEQALLIASGVALDAYVDSAEIVAGEPVKLSVALWNAGAAPVKPVGVGWAGALGAAVPGAPTTGNVEQQLAAHPLLAPGELVLFEQTIAVHRDAAATRPYFLQRPRRDGVYDWSGAGEDERGEPFGAPALSAHLELELAGRRVAFDREAVYRYADQARGEIRKPLVVVPRVEYRVSPEVVVWPRGGPAPEIAVDLASHLGRPLAGELTFAAAGADCGERPSVATPFRIAEPRGTASLRIPAPDCPAAGKPRVHLVLEAATGDGERARPAAPLLDYPHVPPMPLRGGDGFDLVRADIALPKLTRVGYVLGASDKVPGLLAEIGLPIQLLSAADLDHGDLARFDAIVVGSRAYETDTALQKANARLLDYVRAGGLLIVQYQQYPFIDGKFAPFPLEIARPHDRITDETAPAGLLVADHPAFTTPNRIGAADWDGWVQERALYMPGTWDAAYTPLLEFQDPDQSPQKGALLVAALGKGTYVYTGLAFFRQLPAGVPGAYRLFANLLALPHGPTLYPVGRPN
jgi:LmbE family N-acetylglucosaminyl deacetylase